MPLQSKWDSLFLKMSLNVSSMSKDPNTKVGSVIVTPDNRHISFGYNGFVAGVEETPEKWQRPSKYNYVVHSEANALLNCPFETKGCTLYCTHQCCNRCLQLIIQAGIVRFVYISNYENLEHKEIWNEHVKLLKEVKQIGIEEL